MGSEVPGTPAVSLDATEQRAHELANVMAQGNPETITAAIGWLRQQYSDRTMILIQHRAGQIIASAQQYWAQAGEQWHQTLASTGNTPQRLHAQAQQITRERSQGSENTSA